MLRRVQALWKDQRGAYELIQFVLIVPVVFIILYGSFELMKLASIRQSLEAGTYQAARYLSVYHKFYYDSRYNRENANDQVRAERLIWESLLANPYLSTDTRMHIVVRYYNGAGQPIASPADFRCDQPEQFDAGLRSPNTSNLIFTVRAWVTLPWEASVLGLSLGDVTLSSAHTSFVDCGPWFPPPRELTPTPIPTP